MYFLDRIVCQVQSGGGGSIVCNLVPCRSTYAEGFERILSGRTWLVRGIKISTSSGRRAVVDRVQI